MNKFLKGGIAAISLAMFMNAEKACCAEKCFRPEMIIEPVLNFCRTENIDLEPSWISGVLQAGNQKVALETLTKHGYLISMMDKKMQFLKFVYHKIGKDFVGDAYRSLIIERLKRLPDLIGFYETMEFLTEKTSSIINVAGK